MVVDEVAVISNMGAPSRRPEGASLAKILAHYRPLTFLRDPATLDGGDVLRIGRRVFAGLSQRTNRGGVGQLGDVLQAFDYEVQAVDVTGCLHLKSACSYVGNDTILINRAWVDAEQFDGFELLDLPSEEPASRSERVADQECCDHSCFFSQDPRTAEAARVLRSDDRFIRAAKSRSRRDLL